MKRADFSENQTRKPLVDELEAAGAVILPTGVRCPFHDDKHASGSIYQGKDGAWRYHCHTPTCGVSGDVYDLRGMAGKGATSTSKPSPTPSKKNTAPVSFDALRASIKFTIEAEYPYRTPEGEVWGVVFRLRMSDGKKSFRQARPVDGKWEWGAPPKPWILFRLEEIQNAREIVVVEGEKAAEALRAIGEVATTSLCGAGKGAHTDWSPLAGKRVYLWPDNDEPGYRHMQEVRDILQTLNPPVDLNWIEPSELQLPAKGDAWDWLQAGGTIETIMAAAQPLDINSREEGKTSTANDGSSNSKSENQVETLIRISADAALFHANDLECFASIKVSGHTEVHAISGASFRDWLLYKFYLETGRSPGRDALQQALGTLAAKARFEGEAEDVWIRVAQFGNSLFLDLCNDNWDVVEISPTGWRVLPSSPVKFRRARGMLPIPTPVPGDAKVLRRYFNLKDDDDFVLLISALVSSLRPGFPLPNVIFMGEQGSAKSTSARIYRSVIDPHAVPLRSLPRDERDLMISTKSNWLQVFDNLGTIPPWLSDSMCRLATGGGLTTRRLYTDDSESIFTALRPILMTGIGDVVRQPDLLERSILLELDPISPSQRLTEEEIRDDFAKDLPGIIGGILTAASVAINRIGSIKIKNLPRMADFAKFATAAEEGVGFPPGSFLRAYEKNQGIASDRLLDADPVADAILELTSYSDLTGTMGDLLNELSQMGEWSRRGSFGVPRSPRGLAEYLRRNAPGLRRLGITHTPPTGSGHGSRIHRLSREFHKTTASTALTAYEDLYHTENIELKCNDSTGCCPLESRQQPHNSLLTAPEQPLFEVEEYQGLTMEKGGSGCSGCSSATFEGGCRQKRKNKGEF